MCLSILWSNYNNNHSSTEGGVETEKATCKVAYSKAERPVLGWCKFLPFATFYCPAAFLLPIFRLPTVQQQHRRRPWPAASLGCEMDDLYKNLPLERPNAQIRLLCILPGQKDKFELTVHDFDPKNRSVPEYIAVSYTWGDKEPKQSITVNGQVVQVRLHCWQALRQLRSHHNTAIVWIDSICINQSNKKEKNSQVAFMGTIYKQAKSVAACLGPRSDYVFEFVRRALDAHPSDASRLSVAALRAIGETPYFSRIWIKQEIILAAQIALYTSQHIFTWDDIETLITASQAASTTSTKQRDAHVDRVLNVNDDRVGRRSEAPGKSVPESRGQEDGRSRQGLPRPAIVEEMLRYEDSDCGDPRDRIYALLSLVPDGDPARRLFQADYNLSPLGFVRQAAHGLSELHVDSDSQPDVLSCIRKIVRWFDGDSNLIQDIYRLMLDQSPTRRLDGTLLKVSVKEKLAIREPRRHTSRLPSGKIGLLSRHMRAAYLSKNISVSTSRQFETREDHHDFVADLAPCPDAAIQYRIVEEALFAPWYLDTGVVFTESTYCQYYLVSDTVGVGDILASVRWTWSTRDPDASESYAILRREKDLQHAERLRFHSWALPLDLAIVCHKKRVWSGTRFGGSRDTNVLAYRFLHPDGFELPASSTIFAFSLEYAQKGRELDGRLILGEPAPHPAMNEASIQLPSGPPEFKNSVMIGSILQVHHEDAMRLVLAESYNIRYIRPQSHADERSSHAASLPEKSRFLENCCCNLLAGTICWGCILADVIHGQWFQTSRGPFHDMLFEKSWKKSERRLNPQSFRQYFPRDNYGNTNIVFPPAIPRSEL